MHSHSKEEVLPYGEKNRGFGILSLCGKAGAPVIVMFNAGLLHRSEPYRLNTDLSRSLVHEGYDCVRFDLSGKGDTPVRNGLSNRESVAKDWSLLKTAIQARLGKRDLILMGLCSGADNAVKTAAEDNDVTGLILLDPIPLKHPRVRIELIWKKLSNPWFWYRAPKSFLLNFLEWGRGLLSRLLQREDEEGLPSSIYGLRDIPHDSETQTSFTRILSGGGCVFCLFTSYSFQSYTSLGQINKSLKLPETEKKNLVEIYRPDFEHLLAAAEHRSKLEAYIIACLRSWRNQ